MSGARLRFQHAGWVTLSLGLAWFGLPACGSSDGDLFGKGDPIDGSAGEGDAGEPGGGTGGTATGGRDTGGRDTGGRDTGGRNTGGRNTGGAQSGGGAATGGVQTGGTTTGGRPSSPAGGASGGSGNFGGSDSSKCSILAQAIEAELESIQSCESDEECGQVLEGTSCGCTRNWVARLDADTESFEQQLATRIQSCGGGPISTCDCPEADGFKCSANRCGWNYTNQGSECTSTPPGQLCLKGSGSSSDVELNVGDKLEIQVQPQGCFSSSCTEPTIASCSIESEGDDFVATAAFCLTDTGVEGGGCTADCGGGGFAECKSDVTLTEGKHRVTLGQMTLEFTVPGLVPDAAVCAGSPF